MKIRSGFVSNSSSSSFVVAFPRKPTTKKILQEMLFGDKKFYNATYGNNSWSVEEVIDILWRRIEGQSANNVDKIAEVFDGRGAYIDESLFVIDGPRDEYGDMPINWTAYRKAVTSASKKESDSFILSHPGYYIYTFELCDDSSELEGNMEHGRLFDNVPHEIFSNH